MKKILVLGATGAMGKYLVPRLADMNCNVDAVALDKFPLEHPNINSIVTPNARDGKYMLELLANKYDGIVDFLVYNTELITTFLPMMVENCGHYIYLSSYRVYDNKEIPIKETSPRLCDTADEQLIKLSDDYSIYKARGEDVLKLLPQKNWTVIRPAITYSYLCNQLVTLELHNTVGRAKQGKTVVLPEEARSVQATMSWGGDVAEMISKLLFNDKALAEVFTTSTAEHHTWEEVAGYYTEICGLKPLWVPKDEYLGIVNDFKYSNGSRWQLECDRLFDRVIDNSKVLEATGMKQADLMPLRKGLELEISKIPADFKWRPNERMDNYLAKRGIK